MILGVQCLEGLGKVITDYAKGTIELSWGDGNVTLHSGRDSDTKKESLKSLTRMWSNGGQCYAIRMDQISTDISLQAGK